MQRIYTAVGGVFWFYFINLAQTNRDLIGIDKLHVLFQEISATGLSDGVILQL